LSAAGILDCLGGEEEAVFSGVGVVGSVLRGGCVSGLASDPLEEEYNAVYWTGFRNSNVRRSSYYRNADNVVYKGHT
jgi:hypothetical protein